jgi:hypothetical protein
MKDKQIFQYGFKYLNSMERLLNKKNILVTKKLNLIGN